MRFSSPPSCGHFAVRHFQSEAVRLEFLAERFQVADFETNVIERTSLSRSLRLLRLAEIDLAAVEQGGEEVAAGTRLRAERLDVPCRGASPCRAWTCEYDASQAERWRDASSVNSTLTLSGKFTINWRVAALSVAKVSPAAVSLVLVSA